MRPAAVPRLLAVANARAGSADDDLTADVMAALSAGFETELVHTSSAEELDELLADRDETDVVAVLGGDGSLHAVVESLRAVDRLGLVTVALVPLGTGNDFARTLGLARDPLEVARALAGPDARRHRIDLIIDGDDRVVVNAVHLGVGAEAAARSRPWKKRLGPVGYAVGAFLAGVTTPGVRVTVWIDGAPVHPRGGRMVAQVAVGNGRYVGGGTALLPHADPADGLADVAVAYAASWHRRLLYGWRMSRGTHLESEFVACARGREVRVTGGPVRCSSDGELTDPRSEHAWRVEPGALSVLLPV